MDPSEEPFNRITLRNAIILSVLLWVLAAGAVYWFLF